MELSIEVYFHFLLKSSARVEYKAAAQVENLRNFVGCSGVLDLSAPRNRPVYRCSYLYAALI